MYIVYYDSGTTNTRAYLLRDHALISKRQIPVGSRDSAQENGRFYLLDRLHQMYTELLDEFGLKDDQIAAIYMSGMISSPSGIVEIPHIVTPVSTNTLKQQIVSYYEELVFGRMLLIIPGIKTIRPGEPITFFNFEHVNNMRGEEIELIGILAGCGTDVPPLNAIILPGSHSQIAFMEGESITDILSTMTGELFHAITEETLIGSSLMPDGEWQLDSSMVREGYRCLKTYGFNRAVYLVRTMDLFLDSTPSQRISFMEGVLNGGVMDALDRKVCSDPEQEVCIGIAGDILHYEIFAAIAQESYPHYHVVSLIPEDGVPFSVRGLLALID